jgi:hypothetical protein
MLPVPPITFTRSHVAAALRAADRWTLWAFNGPSHRR